MLRVFFAPWPMLPMLVHSLQPWASRTSIMAREDVVPGLLLLHHRVGEHAAVPADVPDRLGQVAVLVAEPEAGVLGDVELAVGVVAQAVAAGLVVGAGAEDRAVVLGDVEVDASRGGARR